MITVVENTPILFSSASKLWLLEGLPPRWRLSKHANPHKIIIEDIDRDVFVRIQTDPLVVGDSIMTDRYHASNRCVIFDLFGGFGNRPGKVMDCPIKFSPVRSSVDDTRGQAEGHYRRLNRNVVSRNEEDNREPLRDAELDAVANLEAAGTSLSGRRNPSSSRCSLRPLTT